MEKGINKSSVRKLNSLLIGKYSLIIRIRAIQLKINRRRIGILLFAFDGVIFFFYLFINEIIDYIDE